MKKLPDRYDAKTREKFWQNYWAEKKIFAWKNDLPKDQTFVIDTPPPTVSGVLHMGHVFSYSQADFVARFQRMSGKDVFYPMGFDDNGLPTERLVEKIIEKKAGVYEAENGHGSFVKKCREVVDEAEKEFEALFNSIALSVDWSQKYQTISPDSQKISQASFVDLYRKGLVEKKFEPVFWDVSDRTALAQADLIDKEVEGMMNYIEFAVECEAAPSPSRGEGWGEGEKITIMTTRPELLPACVAVMVHPEDERYKKFHGKNAITPLFGVKVKIIADDLVQRDKGTGAVMCCTFGDETDIRWWKKHDLPLNVILQKDGKINFDHELVAGKTIKQAKDAIIEALKITRSNHPTLEGGSKSLATSRGGQNAKKAERFYSAEILIKAKELRANQTDAEGLLWHYLKNKQLGEYKFRRQHPFGNYIADFVCLERSLVVELDGGQHAEDEAVKYDQKRTEFLNQSGFRVLRFWNSDVFKNVNDVLDSIFFALISDPAPKLQAASTLPQGEGNLNLALQAGAGPQGEVDATSLLVKQEKITRAVKCAERSGVPIEILVVPQWFVKILDQKDLLKAKAAECNWFPDYMKVRIDQWIDGLAWDWCISRQRFFGVAFPVWYSKRLGEEGKILVADIDQLPCDPNVDLPRGYSREEVAPETDIMDTWATSSISPQLSSKGISAEIAFDKDRHEKLFPADLRPQAHEIIRTWAFYTLVKSTLHQNSIPWKNLMISGWCLAADKTKMSKSKGNVVTPTSLIEEKGSDIVRYWASTSHLGADTAYSEDVFKIGQKLITKLFNAAKFASMNFAILDANTKTENITEAADSWILSRLQQTAKRATEEFEKFEYARAREAIEEFFWHDFCDNYLEICKVRSYGLAAEKLVGVELSESQKQEILAKQQSAILTLKICLNTILKLLAPFIPHICDEIYSSLFAEEFEKIDSINARGNWPKFDEKLFDEKFLKMGEAALGVIFEVRKFKSEKNISMKTTVQKILVNCEENLLEISEDLKNVCNAKEIEFVKSGNLVEVIL
jgi:valyl-tRNA synthetase